MAGRRTSALAGTLVTLVVGTSALLAPPALGHGPGGKPDEAARFAQQVTTRGVWKHLEELQRIADRHGSRAALTEGYEASARYVERTLQKAGYRTTRDPFTFGLEVVDAASLTLSSGASYEVDQMQYAPNSPDGGVNAAASLPVDPTGCDAAAWGDVEVAGTIAVVSRGACPFAQKAVTAEAAGAVGLVVYNNVEEMLFGTLSTEGLVQIPVAGMGMADGLAVVEAVAAGDVSLTLDTRFHTEERTSFNVLAETKAGRDDNVVMLGAHLDGVDEGPGINDNGSGSAVLLEVAVHLAKQKKLNNTVRFAWWGAEELGLIGSTQYVTELAGKPGELDRIATYLNFDMVGSPNYIIGVYDADESTYEAPVDVPEGSAQTEAVLTGYFDRIGQPWVDTEFSGRSDYQAFILNGIPASGLFTGADDIKTDEEVALFGGIAGIRHDPNYHTAADDLANVSRQAIGIMAPAVAYATASLAKDTSAINGVSGPGKPGHPGPGKPGPGKPGHPGKPGKPGPGKPGKHHGHGPGCEHRHLERPA